MDRHRFSFLAHANVDLCSPLHSARLDEILKLVNVTPPFDVFDIGTGKAEVLVRLAERGATGFGVDRSPLMIEEARRRTVVRRLADMIELAVGDANELAGERTFHMVVCMGARIDSDRRKNWKALYDRTKPGGYALVGEGYWQAEPSATLLETLGCSRDDNVSHADNLDEAEAAGWIPLFSTTATEPELDSYEGSYRASIEQYVRTHPDDVDGGAMLERSRGWYRMSVRHLRGVLGFGVYLLQRP